MEKRVRTRKPITTERRQRYIRNGKLYLFMVVCICCMFYAGIYQVFMIKSIHGEEYEKRAINNQVSRVQPRIINPNRGSILDRKQNPLAYSSTVYTVTLDVRNLVELDNTEKSDTSKKDEDKKNYLENTLKGLSETLEIPLEELREYVKYTVEDGKPVISNEKYDTHYLILKKEVLKKAAKELEDKNLRSVYLEEDTKRFYPAKALAGEMVGFIRGDSLWGLERFYNSQLLGYPGRIFRTYEGNNITTTRRESPKEGHTLLTTVDSKVQEIAQDVANAAYVEYNPLNTAVIVMKPKTGEILAMADCPTFDIKDPVNITGADKDDFKLLSDEEKVNRYNAAWRNYNISDTFEPGSIFKPIVVAAALEEGVISKNDTFYCGGKKHFDTERPEGLDIRCHKRTGHGTLTLAQALEQSCNVALMEIGAKLGKEKYLKYRSDFGFGELTGIDLPSEQSSDMFMISEAGFNVIELATGSMGQGFNCTPIQAVNGFNAVINGGNLMQPYIVSQTLDSEGNIVNEHSPHVMRRVISKETSDFLRKCLRNVVVTGTGKNAFIDGHSMGGKTGTGEQGVRGSNKVTLSYVAYTPIDEPEIIVITVVNIPDPYIENVTSVSPMLKDLMTKLIDYLAIPPDNEQSVTSAESFVALSDYTNKSISDVTRELNAGGLDYEIIGSGGDFVYSQIPEGGTKYEENMKIKIYIKEQNQKELLTVPNVLDLSEEDAGSALTSMGFDCVTFQRITDTDEAGEANINNAEAGIERKIVFEQIPGNGVKLEKGSTIKIWVK